MDVDEILKALAHPTRVQMLRWLKEPEKHFSDQAHPLDMGICAGQFERCGLSQSTVSAHLATLQRANLLTSERVGQWIFYRRNEATIQSFLTDLRTLLS
ncbi:metalloregulator ArsR/SmtB family transcription factor [Rhizobium sp. RU36D]|uniref:ArsR/SmtB family transcription factor n=1 Tax=Rhizobium sp. RU36D TaxID=1907415 RepID=UPI0009FC2971|nr:metalloregulator ArsR/SmtB family transcription factor [Rhizobium sp. RU36D]